MNNKTVPMIIQRMAYLYTIRYFEKMSTLSSAFRFFSMDTARYMNGKYKYRPIKFTAELAVNILLITDEEIIFLYPNAARKLRCPGT